MDLEEIIIIIGSYTYFSFACCSPGWNEWHVVPYSCTQHGWTQYEVWLLQRVNEVWGSHIMFPGLARIIGIMVLVADVWGSDRRGVSHRWCMSSGGRGGVTGRWRVMFLILSSFTVRQYFLELELQQWLLCLILYCIWLCVNINETSKSFKMTTLFTECRMMTNLTWTAFKLWMMYLFNLWLTLCCASGMIFLMFLVSTAPVNTKWEPVCIWLEYGWTTFSRVPRRQFLIISRSADARFLHQQ